MTLRIPGLFRLAMVALLVAGVLTAVLVIDRVSTARAVRAVERDTRASAILLGASFRRELEKFQLVPIVLADDREARDALTTRAPARIRSLSAKLEALARETRAANVYLLDGRGITVAASNWNRTDSFLGDDYSYRTYFREAWKRGAASQFALGRRSLRPGLYISRRLDADGRRLGVFVVKVDFTALEREWRDTATRAFVTDGRGIMLVTSDPSWRFQTTRPLSEAARRQARLSLEYGAVPLVQNALFASGVVARPARAGASRAAYVEATEQVGKGWRVHVLAPTSAAIRAAVATGRMVLALTLLGVGALYMIWRHRRRSAAAREEMRVAARLADLDDRLVQANKLATLGQVTAGVGHEINQPVAAIAAYAHNARTLIERDRSAEATEAIGRVIDLTQRIGAITRELRGFARRGSGETEAVVVPEVVEGVALLLRHRLRSLGAELVMDGEAAVVRAERVRLEQVLTNLAQNALDAGARTVTVSTRYRDATVEIAIADDGPGISEAMRAQLFQPFRTSKRDGLGLGLVICQDIITSMGGTIEVRSPATGAEFMITLERHR